MIWKDYGTRAQLVVHQPPFVEACVLDGYGLEPWVPGGRPPKHRGHGRQSSQGKIAFARDVMAVCEAAADLDGFVDGLRHKLHELDLINRSGRLNRMLLARMLASYVIKHYRGSALEQVFDVENACNPLYEFLRRPEYTAPPHYVVVLYALLRDTQPVTFVPADHTIAALQGTWGPEPINRPAFKTGRQELRRPAAGRVFPQRSRRALRPDQGAGGTAVAERGGVGGAMAPSASGSATAQRASGLSALA
jgi:hypothetical protein